MTGFKDEQLETYNYHKGEVVKIVERENKEDIAQCTIYTKSYHVKKMAEILEQIGESKENIAARLYDDLRDQNGDSIVSKRLIRFVCSMLGYTDQRKNRSEEFAAKSAAKNSSRNGSQQVLEGGSDDDYANPGSERPTDQPPRREIVNPYKTENAEYIAFVEDVISACHDIKARLESEHFMSEIPKKQAEEHIYVGRASLELINQMWDKRRTILRGTQSYLTQLVLTQTIAHAAGNFQTYIKNMGELTSKQATKTLRGAVKDVDWIYEPTSREEATIAGFIGVQCVCGNWRVKPDGNMAYCFKCTRTFSVPKEKLGYVQMKESEAEETGE